MTGVLQMEIFLGAGASALALAWITMLAPWIARTTSMHLRSALARDIEATRQASIDELMPSVLTALALKIALWILCGAWILAFAVLWLRVGISSWPAWAYSMLFAALLLLSLIDLDTQLLPRTLVDAVLWAGILAAACELIPLPLAQAIFGTTTGWILFSLPNWGLTLARPTDQPAVGAGDVSLIAACGAWLGPQAVILAGCIAILAAMATRCALTLWNQKAAHERMADEREVSHLPFGPLISMASIAVLCFDPYHHLLT